jgi:hypothetical protein
MAFIPISLNRSYSRTALLSPLTVFKIKSYICLVYNLCLRAPNFKQTLMVAIKQGVTAEVAISGVIEMSDSMINHNPFLIAKWSS